MTNSRITVMWKNNRKYTRAGRHCAHDVCLRVWDEVNVLDIKRQEAVLENNYHLHF